MLEKMYTIASQKHPLITMFVTPGHFATSSSHISHYLDMNELKTNASVAQDVAHELGSPYLTSTLVDTIVCMEGTEMIGAFLAQNLSQAGSIAMNMGGQIHVITPKSNTNGQLVFPKSSYTLLDGKNVLLLVASVSSGMTICRALECLSYYGGKLAGISAIFSAEESINGHPIHALFTHHDIDQYHFSTAADCPMCRHGKPLDAIITGSGYHML